MQAPLYVLRFTEEERAAIEAGRRSSQGFTVRRGPLLLASAEATINDHHCASDGL